MTKSYDIIKYDILPALIIKQLIRDELTIQNSLSSKSFLVLKKTPRGICKMFVVIETFFHILLKKA